MKRQLNGKAISSKKSRRKLSTLPNDNSKWTQEEDDYLQSTFKKVKKVNWRIVCQAMNRAFTISRRTAKECEARFKFLSTRRDSKPWSTAEEIIFLCSLSEQNGIWEGDLNLEINRSQKNVMEHSRKLAKEVADRIKSEKENNFDGLKPIIQFGICVYLWLMLKNFEESGSNQEILEEISESNITEERCLEYAQKIGMCNKQKLGKFITCIIERLQNGILAEDKEKSDSLEELLHKKSEENRRPDIYMQIIPPETTGQNQRLIAIYFISNY